MMTILAEALIRDGIIMNNGGIKRMHGFQYITCSKRMTLSGRESVTLFG